MSDKLSDAVNAIRQWHYEEIRSIVDHAVKEINEEKPSDREEWMREHNVREPYRRWWGVRRGGVK